jgi:hypothetical protein
MLYWAFHFLPGQVVQYRVDDGRNTYGVRWEVKTDFYNNTYIECEETGAKAWFVNDGTLFYFTHFEGKRTALLYYFFLGAFRVLMASQPGLIIRDTIPLHLYTRSVARWLNDFIAPFRSLMRARYVLSYSNKKQVIGEEVVALTTETHLQRFWSKAEPIQFDLRVQEYRLDHIKVNKNGKEIVAKWERLESL